MSNQTIPLITGTEEARPLLRPDLKLWSKHWLVRSCTASCILLVIVILCAWALSGRMFATADAIDTPKTFNNRVIHFGNHEDSKPGEPSDIKESVLHDAGGKGNNGYMAVVGNAAANFHIKGSCDSLARTSVTSAESGCRHAVNGGPFQSYWRGGCIGPMIQHGQVINADWNTSYAVLGVGGDGLWVMGHLSAARYKEYGIVEAVAGFGWLVIDGQPVAPDGDELAERTAVGVNAKGELILLQVDGCERCPLSGGPSGLTLSQLAHLLVSKGALHAINLDGGGSSTTVIDGVVQNWPDCLELGFSCERPVTSVICIK